MTRLSDLPEKTNTRQFWRLIGEGVSNRIRRRVQQSHRNANGQRFKSYSDTYEQRKSEGDAAPRGVPQSSRSTTPDMTLTGKTMADLQTQRIRKKGVEIGWSVRGGVVEELAKRKNYQIVNLQGARPFADAEMQWIDKEINIQHDKVLKKYAKKPVTIRTGK